MDMCRNLANYDAFSSTFGHTWRSNNSLTTYFEILHLFMEYSADTSP